MLARRVIPCLDVRDGRVVKGTAFKDLKDIGDPAEFGRYYSLEGADELVFYDITASHENRMASVGFVFDVAKEIDIPFCVGGGVTSIDDFKTLLSNGADKVSVNSGAVRNPDLITEAARKYGSQCVVLSIDAKRNRSGSWDVFVRGGRENTGIDAVWWAKEGVRRGAGELVINSIDADGMRSGYDIRLMKAITDAVTVPVIASGGAGEPEHFIDAVLDADVSGVLAASGVLHWQSGNVTGVDIVLSEIVLAFGASEQLEYSVSPSDAPDTFTTWSSSDEGIVIAHADGLIEGVGQGTATVTVTTRDGGFTDTITVTVEDYIHVDSVDVTSPDLTLPEANNIDDRPEVTIGTTIVINVSVLPLEADYPGYTITTSNSRAVADGNTVSFVYGNTGPGNVSVNITFEDATVPSLEYRFKTVEGEPADVPITSVDVTAGAFVLPDVNNIDDRDQVTIGTVITLEIAILPENATNTNYVVSTSNSRAEADGNTITFVYGNTGPGSVSVKINFEDTSVGDNGLLEYRFTTVEAIPLVGVTITSPDITLPAENNADDRMDILIGTVITITVTLDPENANLNTGFSIETSNSRAEADGNTITFVYGATGPGRVSVKVIFDDVTLGDNGVFEYRFNTTEA